MNKIALHVEPMKGVNVNTLGVWQQGAQENIWIEEGYSNRRLENMHYQEFHNLCALQNIMRIIKARRTKNGRARSSHRENMNTCKVLVGKPEGKRLLGRTRLTRMLENSIKMDLREIE
jgi:hypothetical protein